MQAPSLRRVALVAGSFTAAATMAITCAPGALAAAPNTATQASAQAGQLRLGTTAPLTTTRTSVVWTPGTVGVVKKTTNPAQVLGNQNLLKVGVGATTAAAGRNASYGCTGLLSAGGTVTADGGGACRAVYPSSGGVALDLSALTSALPIGIGSIGITANGITANARYRDGVSSGIGRIDNASLTVCLGVTLNGACVGSQVKVPLNLNGSVNEDVVSAVLVSLTKSPQLAALVAPLTSALRPVVSLRTNVQSVNATTGVRTVVGLQVNLLQRTAAISNLAVATAGPYVAS